MCGIAGFSGSVTSGGNDREARASRLAEMCARLAHRGPDGRGVFVSDEIALGMQRLAIIDVAGGAQPLSGCTDQIKIIFNGEIYNHRELRAQLIARGHRFRTQSDTEVIVHAYEEWGAAGCAESLRGMFAFALYDARRQQMFLARDRVGKKPLYYARTPRGEMVFGSELKALLAHPDVARELDLSALDAYISFGYVPDPLCIFKDIHKLPPAHYLLFDLTTRQFALKSYWDFPYGNAASDQRADDAGKGAASASPETLRALLTAAVETRMEAEVPLGAFLSGGVDSSAIVALMARRGAPPVKTFSIGFEEDAYNELGYARMVADKYRTEHHELIVTPADCDVVDELAWSFGEPFADSSAIPTYLVAKFAREQVTVALSGDGGDELFAGYIRYLPTYWQSHWTKLPRAVRHGVMQNLSRRLPHGFRGRNYLHDVAYGGVERYIENVALFSRLSKLSLYGEDFRATLDAPDAMAQEFYNCAMSLNGDATATDRLLYLDSKTYLPGDILTKVDRTSMAVSLEVRAPLLDQNLIEYVARLPAALKLKDNAAKIIFKEAVRDLVPAEILVRPKQGFGVPLDRWLNAHLRDRVRGILREPKTRARGYFNPRYIETLLDEHERGRRNHAGRLWALFMLELWHRAYLDAGGAAASEARCAPQSRAASVAPALPVDTVAALATQ